MTNDQEIRAKALELAIQAFAVLPSLWSEKEAKELFLKLPGQSAQEKFVFASRYFEAHIKG